LVLALPRSRLLTSALLLVGLCGSASAKRQPPGAFRRGERKVSWSVVAVTGATGSTGQQGASGQGGSDGADEALLKAQIGALSQRVETLEGILQGITNSELLGAVAGVATLTAACDALVEQSNDLGAGVEGLIDVLTGVPLIGDIFGEVDMPSALDPLDTCTDSET
jgi:hypothetical protein